MGARLFRSAGRQSRPVRPAVARLARRLLGLAAPLCSAPLGTGLQHHMCQDSEGPKRAQPASRESRGDARAQLNRELASMFAQAAAEPLPEDLLDLVDQLEAQQSRPERQGD